MYETALPGPVVNVPRQEHAAADSGNLAKLLDAIPDELGALSVLSGKHLLSTRHLSPRLILQILRLAARFESGEFDERRPLNGKILSNVFLDSSRSHTRLSFNSAWLRLGGTLLNFEKSIDEVTRTHHAPDEIVELCNNYGDLAVLRTLDSQSFDHMLEYFRVPVINAGSGDDQHPTHALADLYTLFKWRPELMGLQDEPVDPVQIAVFGSPADTRTIRSFLDLVAMFPGAVERVVVFERLEHLFTGGQREELQKAGLNIQTVSEILPVDTNMQAIRKLLPEMDVVYVHHKRPMHATRMDLVEAISHLKADALVFNPHIQTEEFSNHLNDSPRNGYFAQARGAVYVRMALFSLLLGTPCSEVAGAGELVPIEE